MKGFFDSFRGLVPVKLIRRYQEDDRVKIDKVELEVTDDHGSYKKGERIHTLAYYFVRVTRQTEYQIFVTHITES